MKYAASMDKNIIARKKPMIAKFPELKIGEGPGCMTFSAAAKTASKVMMKIKFASDVTQPLLMSHKPTCKRMPVTAKITA